MQDGLLNGTAPLNSSRSTAAALHVTGNSTFAVRPIEPPPHAAQVFAESTHALGSSATSTLSFTGQAYAINSSLHSTATNPERLTPQSTGLWRFTAQVNTNPVSTLTPIQVSIVDSRGNCVRPWAARDG
jgi:hypothetical protein